MKYLQAYHGKDYQTRINRILRVVMESQPARQVQP
jgi:uncharacterized protein (DUF4415 family)